MTLRLRQEIEHPQARMSTVDGFPYKEEVGGSNPSVPTKGIEKLRSRSSVG